MGLGCKTGFARCSPTGSCLSMSTTSNCNRCGNACRAPYSKCDKEMGCVGKFTLPATFQLCTGAVGAQTCAAPLFGAGYASIMLVKTVPLRTSSGELRQQGLMTIWASMGTKIKSASGTNVDTGGKVDLDLNVPVTSMKHDPMMGGWVVEHQIEFSFKHVAKMHLLVTVEQPNGKVLNLMSNEITNDVPPETENAVDFASRLCLYY
jgi:hypothetical protein